MLVKHWYLVFPGFKSSLLFSGPPKTRSFSTAPSVFNKWGMATVKHRDRENLIPSAIRLKDGRALQLDVWSVFNASNLPPDCINLGQGYMNFAPLDWARRAGEEALSTVDGNHYAPTRGRPHLRKAIRSFYGTEFGKELDIDTEITVTSGANGGQYAAFTAFVNPGDEVIIFEPFFDQYLASIAFNGGRPVFVPLHPSTENVSQYGKRTWTLDIDELRCAITPRTKMIVLNTPQNPLGKVFTKQELEGIAEIAEKHNLLVMSDEVYEKLVYDGKTHTRFASLPGMWDHTITVGSAGKMFAATGWRVGWLVGPPSLISPALAASTRIVFCANTPLQEAAAAALEQAGSRKFFQTQLSEYNKRRNILCSAFDRLGMSYTHPEGSFYAVLDTSRVSWPQYYPFPRAVQERGRDYKAAWFMAMEVGVSCVPISDFFCDEHKTIGESYARFSFGKDFDTLKVAGERLQRLAQHLR